MKMTITNSKHNVVVFGSLSVGEVFIGEIGDVGENETDILMRIEKATQYNAVSLSDGTLYAFPPNEEIKLVEAELSYSVI
jgi:hypothetical protein